MSKVCPYLLPAEGAWDVTRKSECIEDDCAMWDENMKCCMQRSIGFSLHRIEVILENFANER